MTSSVRTVQESRRPQRQLVQMVALGSAQVLAWASLSLAAFFALCKLRQRNV